MTTTITPSTTKVECDGCGRFKGEGELVKARDPKFSLDGKLVFTFNHLDFGDVPVAGSKTELDFCDECLGEIREVILTKAKELKEAREAQS